MRKNHDFAPALVTEPVEAIRRVIYDSHALEASAQAIGLSHQTLSKKLNPDEEAQLSARQLAALEQFLDTDALAECFSARRGGVFVKMPAAGDQSDKLLEDFRRLAQAFGRSTDDFCSVVADGKVTLAEFEKLRMSLHAVFVAGERLILDAQSGIEK